HHPCGGLGDFFVYQKRALSASLLKQVAPQRRKERGGLIELRARLRASAATSSLRRLEIGQHFLVVAFGFDLLEDVLNFSVGADDERRAGGAHVFLAVHALFLPDAVLLGGRMISDDQKRE